LSDPDDRTPFGPVRDLPSPFAGDEQPIERLAVEDLEQSSDWLRVVAASTTLGIFVYDRERFLWVNRAMERLTGASREALLARSPLDLADEETRRLILERWEERQRRRDASPRRCEAKLQLPDGGERWVELALSSIEYRGRLAGLGTAFDVTERKLAEQALRASEERLQLAQHAGDIVVWDWDIPADRIGYSAHARNLLNLGPEDSVSSREFFSLVHPQDLPRLESALKSALDDDRDYFVEHRLVLSNGQTRWLAQRGKVVREDSGRPTRLLGVSIDITHRKLAEEALFQEKERAQVTLASIGDGVIRTDVRGMVDYMNPAAERLTGWAIHEAYGKHLRDVFQIIDPDTHTMLLDPVTRCLAEGRYVEFPGERMLQPRDGHPVAVRDSASPIVNRQGRTVGAVLAFKDVTELRQMERERSFMSTHDPLTGLLNRRTFEEEVERAVRRARERRGQHAVFFLDLDQFKLINDTCGHFAGDELLKLTVERLQARLPTGALFARIGGDEFAALLPEAESAAALDLGLGLKHALEQSRFSWEDRVFEISASIGVAMVGAETPDGAAALAAADAACFVAKQRGGNRVHEYRPGDDAIAQRVGELHWIQQIHKAFETGNFRLYAQRIEPLDPSLGREPLAEIFIRMLSERGEPVPTAAFIAAAERYHLISTLDRWVVRESFRQIVGDEGVAAAATSFSVNLSGQSLGEEGFLDFVQSEIDSSRIDPKRVCFEITETAAIANLSSALRFISALRSLGCRFVLDDFGSGFSSFAYLKNLPVDYLKIDASFTHQLPNDPIQRALVESIQQIAHVLGMRTIAEGIEDEETLRVLREIGVDYGQGYALHRPGPLGELRT
jgi:diguanylate cyclase (GGDEF)-like protein/PAS domain S-box-containing protein